MPRVGRQGLLTHAFEADTCLRVEATSSLSCFHGLLLLPCGWYGEVRAIVVSVWIGLQGATVSRLM